MDLFKIAWRLQSFTSSTLLSRDPTVALEARTLDAEAVPTMVAITLDFSGIMRPSSVTLSSCKLDSSSSCCPTSAHRTVVGTCVDAGPDTSCPMNLELFYSAFSSHNQPYFIFLLAFSVSIINTFSLTNVLFMQIKLMSNTMEIGGRSESTTILNQTKLSYTTYNNIRSNKLIGSSFLAYLLF